MKKTLLLSYQERRALVEALNPEYRYTLSTGEILIPGVSIQFAATKNEADLYTIKETE